MLALPEPQFPLKAYSLENARSMLPLLAPGTRLLVDHNAYADATPRMGEIIVFYPPRPFGDKAPSDSPFVSRVAGLAGDTVQLPDQSVGRAKPGTSGEPPVCDVEEGCVYVAATNPEVPLFFFVPLGNVIGRAEFIYWPPSRMGRIERR
jgi:signal peptidase I